MERIFYIFILCVSCSFLTSNSAQPGVWNAGGSGTFTLLYPEDSIAYKKIQMKSEKIFMQLYRGFAVVKGNYHFKNTSKDTLRIKVGYPINNVFENINYNEYVNQVTVDNLYKVKGFVNQKELPLFKEPNANKENWYVWEVVFPLKKLQNLQFTF